MTHTADTAHTADTTDATGTTETAPATGAQVHQAVTELVSERGYGNFTVGEVAARAGVADSSIY
ncbi:TetR family transcriptional regulator, partial [Streptomyces olivaceus]|uniref:TetR family transcriptional regulator n=1 Tax=Streptomyces olivaceus TaxID=47716 RepID=UPI00362A2A7A